MTNSEIEARLKVLVAEERRVTSEIVSLIRLVDERKLYLDQGYPTLFDWLVRKFHYSESAAYRRIQAARLVRAVPEAATALTAGTVTLSALAKAQSAIQGEEKRLGKKLDPVMKATVVSRVLEKNSHEVERNLAELFPHAPKADRIKIVDPQTVRLNISISFPALEDLRAVRALWAHRLPKANLGAVIHQLAKDFLRKQSSTAAVSRSTKMRVLVRDNRACQYRDPSTGRLCGSRYQVEVDHIRPKALGGSDDLDNLRCLCRAHNQRRAELTFGARPRV